MSGPIDGRDKLRFRELRACGGDRRRGRSDFEPLDQKVDARSHPDECHRPGGVTMAAGEHLPTAGPGSAVEAPMGAVIAFDGFEQIAGRLWVRRRARHLAGIARFGEIAVEQTGKQPIGKDRLKRGDADPNLPAGVKGPEINRARRYFGLIDRRDRLRLMPGLVPRPVELRSIDGGKIDLGQSHVDFIVIKLGTKRIQEAPDGEFGTTIDGLERHRPIKPRRIRRRRSIRDCAVACI